MKLTVPTGSSSARGAPHRRSPGPALASPSAGPNEPMASARKRIEEEAQARPADTGSEGENAGESQIRQDEVYRMAAFRIRETANRIATLANSARDDDL